MIGKREHRSERPAVWDYANPTAEARIPLRKRLAAPTRRPSRSPGGKGGAPPGPRPPVPGP